MEKLHFALPSSETVAPNEAVLTDDDLRKALEEGTNRGA
jgi:hypothetical protein